jgi:hypothetical protein
MASGEMSAAEFTAFLTRACALLARHSADGSLHYLCMDWRHMAEVLAAGREVYTKLKNLCVWPRITAGWARSTAASMNWSSSSNLIARASQ